MTEVHPTLEAVARAIMGADGPAMDDWTQYVPEARAAFNALADELPGVWSSRGLREIAAEPKSSVEDLLYEFTGTTNSAREAADMLREAGLLKDEIDDELLGSEG